MLVMVTIRSERSPDGAQEKARHPDERVAR
jgi:hypothetical protein